MSNPDANLPQPPAQGSGASGMPDGHRSHNYPTQPYPPQQPEPRATQPNSPWTNEPSPWSNTEPEKAADFRVTQNPYGDASAQPTEPQTAPSAPQQTFKQVRTGVGDYVEQPADGPTIQQYRRGSLWTFIIPALVLIAAGGLIWYGTRPPEVPTGSPTPSSSSPYRSRTPIPTSTGLPGAAEFINNRVEGTFYIDSATWNGDQLTVAVRIELRQGNLSYRFLAMDVKNGGVLRSTSTTGDLRKGSMRAGETVSGTVIFNKERAATQIALGEGGSSGSLAIIRVPG